MESLSSWTCWSGLLCCCDFACSSANIFLIVWTSFLRIRFHLLSIHFSLKLSYVVGWGKPWSCGSLNWVANWYVPRLRGVCLQVSLSGFLGVLSCSRLVCEESVADDRQEVWWTSRKEKNKEIIWRFGLLARISPSRQLVFIVKYMSVVRRNKGEWKWPFVVFL